uniref:Uncharacterized protein n=1 Tax=Arundo donax TaxID=35708 RepID=A0A0A9HQ12_ARUDO
MKPLVCRCQIMGWICWSVDSVGMGDWMMPGSSCVVLLSTVFQ